MGTVLIVDDHLLWSHTLASLIKGLGHEPLSAGTMREGLALARSRHCDVVMLDILLPDGSGLDAIGALQAAPSQPEVIIVTGTNSREAARLALEHRAWDFISKTSSLDNMRLSLERALQYRRNKRLPGAQPLLPAFKRRGIVGEGPALQHTLEAAAKAADWDLPVCIYGETGTGKELMARAIHYNSPRAAAPFVVVDCASLPETLMEAELFGRAKGAYTGADKEAAGLVARAHGGSLFLDEIGELPLEMQQKLLRVLQEKRFRPVGASQEQTADFRLISATNRDLNALSMQGAFRSDLYYRIQAITVSLPPLRDRVEDIPVLAHHFANDFSIEGKTKQLSDDAITVLQAYSWPGNVRELRNVIGGAVAFTTESDALFPIHLPPHIRLHAMQSVDCADDKDACTLGEPLSWKQYKTLAMGRIEKEYLARLLTFTDNDKSRAMEISGLSRAQFYRMHKKMVEKA